MEVDLPRIGLGTWKLDRSIAARIVSLAIDMGYRHVDTAQIYGNEAEVGDGIAAATVDRENLIVATKVWVDRLAPRKVRPSVEESLRKLKLDYVDLLYVHWPAGKYEHCKTLDAFNELIEDGLVRNTCVSNFTPSLVDEALDTCGAAIVVNQVEHHPLLQQRELLAHHEKRGIQVVAYSPLARGDVLDVPEIVEIARKHAITPAQVSLAWVMEHGAIPIPKSSSEAHLQENLDALDVQLDARDIERIGGIERENRKVSPLGLHPDW
ncbi:aldo/keto reductase [Candidatus Bathyarchaeota archaeon]|nr:aldo/keto reductase [Candidatus Bathyarchaeota archaeon]